MDQISVGVKSRERNPDDRVHEEIVTAANGEEYFLKSTDPYGLWTVKKMKGQTPVIFNSNFTSRSTAYSALKNYLDRIFQELKDHPPLKRKTVKTNS